MEKTFSWSRFEKVLRKDLMEARSQFGLTLLIIALLPVLPWFTQLSFGGQDIIIPEIRWCFILVCTLLAAIMAPSRIYKSCNIPNKGIYFAMLPASKCEKFLSMVLTTGIIAPLLCLIASLLIDTILAMLPFGAYKEFLFGQFVFEKWSIAAALPLFAVGIAHSATFFFTATLFKRNKVVQTVLWIWLIGFVLTIAGFPILSILAASDALQGMMTPFENYSEDEAINLVYWGYTIINIIWAVVFYGLAARRLNRMNY